jgi:hypothetical protein
MIIVHVAIISGCLLASNNPSTSSGIVGSENEALEGEDPQQQSKCGEWISHNILGWSNAYDTEFQPVSLWSRGNNKLSWIKNIKSLGR